MWVEREEKRVDVTSLSYTGQRRSGRAAARCALSKGTFTWGVAGGKGVMGTKCGPVASAAQACVVPRLHMCPHGATGCGFTSGHFLE